MPDGQGALIKGTAKEVSVCSGSGSDTARFTPYITRPQNWDFQLTDNDYNMVTFGTAQYGFGTDLVRGRYDKYFLISEGERFYPFLGIDITNDGVIDPMNSMNSEIFRFTAMRPYMQAYYILADTWYYTNWADPWVHFNTTNTRYDDFSCC
ncbi:MAG: hypothetical protein R2883_00280 [Caldisericia bacterium]